MLSRTLTRKEQFVIAFLGVSIILGAGSVIFFGQRAPEPPLRTDTLSDAIRVEPAATPSVTTAALIPVEPPPPLARPGEPELAVYVRGQVARPGLYRVSPDARIEEIIEDAGGTTDSANLADINLAARLLDGTTLTIPSVNDQHYTVNPPEYTVSGWRPASQATSPSGAPTAFQSFTAAGGAPALVNVNTADQQTLETLPGIGPVLAAGIISYRAKFPFQSVEDLEQVPGIGPKRLETIRHLVTVR